MWALCVFIHAIEGHHPKEPAIEHLCRRIERWQEFVRDLVIEPEEEGFVEVIS